MNASVESEHLHSKFLPFPNIMPKPINQKKGRFILSLEPNIRGFKLQTLPMRRSVECFNALSVSQVQSFIHLDFKASYERLVHAKTL